VNSYLNPGKMKFVPACGAMMKLSPFLALTLILAESAAAQTDDAGIVDEVPTTDSRPVVAPDIRGDDTDLKLQKGNLVIVPVPFSNPTLDSGLIVAGAYFHPQTEAQEKAQPASLTAAAAMYSSNDSLAYGIGHQHYWNEDRWRFSGALGRANLNLLLRGEDAAGVEQQATWLFDGKFFYSYLSREIRNDWYAGIAARYVDADQVITFDDVSIDAGEDAETTSSGLGVNVEFDSRDMPFNSYAGNLFQLKTLFNAEALGGDANYQSFSAAFRSYRELIKSLVLAWEVQACRMSGDVPLWDSCRIELRGFPSTDFLGKRSASGQAEIRWQMSPRWGLVGFAGGGYMKDSLNQAKENELIPSYGVGVRFMVLKAKRINLRLDYARSGSSDAIYVSAGEAF